MTTVPEMVTGNWSISLRAGIGSGETGGLVDQRLPVEIGSAMDGEASRGVVGLLWMWKLPELVKTIGVEQRQRGCRHRRW